VQDKGKKLCRVGREESARETGARLGTLGEVYANQKNTAGVQGRAGADGWVKARREKLKREERKNVVCKKRL